MNHQRFRSAITAVNPLLLEVQTNRHKMENLKTSMPSMLPGKRKSCPTGSPCKLLIPENLCAHLVSYCPVCETEKTYNIHVI